MTDELEALTPDCVSYADNEAAQAAETSPSQVDPPPDPITLHPMWETQVALERGMLREGRDAFTASVTEAREREQMTRLAPVRGLIKDWLPPIAAHLREWVKLWSKASGERPNNVRPKAFDALKDIDPHVAVLIALRETLDGLDTGRVNITGLARRIGGLVEHEMQVRRWEDQEPALFYTAQKHLEDLHATTAHRRRFNINQFNDMMAKKMFAFGWDAWGEDLHFRVGIELLNAIVRVTGWFEFTPDPSVIPGRKMKAPYILTPKPNILSWLTKTLKHAALTHPAYKPTVVPPRHWEGTRSGGYWTPYIKTPRLIRYKANQQDQQDRAADEYEALDMPQVYSALHFLQEVPWRINKRVHAVFCAVQDRNLAIAGIQDKNGKEMPIKPPGFIGDKGFKGDRWEKADKDAVRVWKGEASAIYKHNATLFSKSLGVNRTRAIADEYAGFERFYFPHMLDFRGRAYPIPVVLQPQGADLARGLLEFADGRPIANEDDAGWLMLQLASTWGWDKLSNDHRISHVAANEELWREIAADPLGEQEWTKQDKPWQALAAIFEWVAFLDHYAEHGYGYVSHLVCSVDGTCNGIQHLSAMTRDRVAGEYVNLVPGPHPRDIYKHVAEALQETLERIEEQGTEECTQIAGPPHPGMEMKSLAAQHASYWLNLCNRQLPRKLTKRQVMVLPYGGTRDSYIKYTREWLDEHDPVVGRPAKEEADLRFARILFLVNHLWEAVNRVIPGAVVVMGWLRDCARHASVGNQPIFWRTASGFVVRHFYGERKHRQAKVMLDGVTVFLEFPKTTKELDVQSQLRGISPNFVHSQDAAALMLCINAAARDGVTAFCAIHDAFGSHAAAMGALGRHLRDAFVQVHSQNVLEGYRNACLSVMVAEMASSQDMDPFDAAQLADEKLPPVPAMGNLDLDGVLLSDYFFA